MTKKKAISLLSGGLDSTVSLLVSRLSYDVNQAMFFDYGQKSLINEIKSVNKISEFYEVPYKIIKLDWLKEITKTSLVRREKALPEYNIEKLDSEISVLKDSAKSVWVPNRNGVMLSICAAYADSYDCDAIIFGANVEEASTFPDNSLEYVDKISETFSYSTSNGVEVVAPLVKNTKTEIVAIALEHKMPFDMLWSCYLSEDKHCGKCESCARLKRALINNDQQEIWRSISS